MHREGSPRQILLVLCLLAITIMVLDNNGLAPLKWFRNGVTTALIPAQNTVRFLTSPFESTYNGITKYDDLKSSYDRVVKERDALKTEKIAEADAVQELKRLKEIDGIATQLQYGSVVARVISDGVGNQDQNYVQLDKGASSGIEVGMPVVTSGGFAGRVTAVSRNRCTVQLISDPEFRFAVRLVGSGDKGVGHGTGTTSSFLIDQAIELESDIPKNESVVTAGTLRSAVPDGLVVGSVSKVTRRESQRTQDVEVTLATDLGKLDYVRVLAWKPTS